ncbi:phenylalanine--tRNA ligase subunit alpha [Candidatus Peregrinibacteria bacterium RIFOXYB2_FULL_32_7]|nr:MAG: phenylalanine--tRNA ligase subunit alpha [Candidatus Peregrinibacteria bacterium RIFOXYB2_FULL_32_7]
MKEKLQNLQKTALKEIFSAKDLKTLKEVAVAYLGKKGKLTEILHGVKDLPAESKPIIGKLSNEIKVELEKAFADKNKEIENLEIAKSLNEEWIDLTASGEKYEYGHLHPLTKTQHEVENIFHGMGFMVADGPEVECEKYNFDDLNIPATHPARDMQDTFFLDKKPDVKLGKLVLRTHTSPVQVRTMLKYGAPLKIIVPGRVFRNEALDACHEHTFDQVEGLMIDKEISLAHLKGVMAEFLSKLFEKEVKVRFRPGYFPFVEPGLELDMSCTICGGVGCKTCKHAGWLEFMGAGMVHPNVLKAGGIDPNVYQGWAFGFGLTRLIMMRYGIDDIRVLNGGDLRFVEQF